MQIVTVVLVVMNGFGIINREARAQVSPAALFHQIHAATGCREKAKWNVRTAGKQMKNGA